MIERSRFVRRERRSRVERCRAKAARALHTVASAAAVLVWASAAGADTLTATALVAFVAEIHRFPSGRHFASYLGLCPRESSSGNTRRLGRISKRGDTYLRMLLIHGARSSLLAARRRVQKHPLDRWVLDLEQRRGHNRAAVALANKMARLAWTVWKEDRDYRGERKAA